MADRAAEEALRYERASRLLEPMRPGERKIVHLFLRERPDVRHTARRRAGSPARRGHPGANRAVGRFPVESAAPGAALWPPSQLPPGSSTGSSAALAAEADPPTTLRARERALDAHLADSLAGLEVGALLGAPAVVDVGAGAGFPGLPLAIALTGARVDLLEAARRKCAVIDRLIAASAVSNARAVVAGPRSGPRCRPPQAAGAGHTPPSPRGRSRRLRCSPYAAPLLVRGGVLIAWKGARHPGEERRARAAAETLGMELEEVRPVVPFEGARHRHLHVLRKVADTPSGIPRRPGMARKRPLG